MPDMMYNAKDLGFLPPPNTTTTSNTSSTSPSGNKYALTGQPVISSSEADADPEDDSSARTESDWAEESPYRYNARLYTVGGT